MKRGKEFFSEKPARRKAPKQEAIEEKGVVGNAGDTSPCKKAENKNLFCGSGLVDQVELSVLICDCWLGNVVKRSRQNEEKVASSFGHEIGIKTSLCSW